jgi:hypothetical protein
LAAWLKWYSTCLSKCKALSSNPRTKNKTFSKIGKKISGEKKLKYCAYKICCPFPNSILHIISGEKSHSGIYTHKYNIHGFYTYNTNHCKQISSTNFLEISNFSHKEDKLLKTIQRAVTEGKIYSIES